MEINTFSRIEIRVIQHIQKIGKRSRFFIEDFPFNETETMRAFQFLSNKGLGKLEKESDSFIELTDKGVEIKTKGLPEQRLLNFLKEKRKVSVDDIKFLSSEELTAAIGKLKKLNCIEVEKGEKIILNFKNDFNFPQVKFFEQQFPISVKNISDSKLLDELIKRGLIRIVTRNKWFFVPSQEIYNIDLSNVDLIEKIDKNVIENEEWLYKDFRKYDLISPLPKILGGRKHILTETIEEIKRIWVEMGFKEMEGDHIQTSFWNLDCLFVPQDHPARTLQDTLFIGSHKILNGEIKERELMEAIKNVHEEGTVANSTGWKEKWDEEIAEQLLLRTHTTVLSARTLYELKKQNIFEGKFFAVGKVYRNEA
ncbi:MAG: hypothetical protein QXD62_03990, partial [Candidatus Woesearchaeota archaeon]